MDTRIKIVTIHDAARHANRTAVLATFDVLRAPFIRQLEDLAAGGSLLAIVTEEAGSLLPLRARAELAASLAVIEFVLTGPEMSIGLFPNLVDTREADRCRSAELTASIKRQHRAAANA